MLETVIARALARGNLPNSKNRLLRHFTPRNDTREKRNCSSWSSFTQFFSHLRVLQPSQDLDGHQITFFDVVVRFQIYNLIAARTTERLAGLRSKPFYENLFHGTFRCQVVGPGYPILEFVVLVTAAPP